MAPALPRSPPCETNYGLSANSHPAIALRHPLHYCGPLHAPAPTAVRKHQPDDSTYQFTVW
jgi:hypothetical protein